MIHVVEDRITTAWLHATDELYRNNGDAFAATVHTRTTSERDGNDLLVRSELDALLRAKGKPDTQTVANTIFPAAIAGRGAGELYSTYEHRIWPVIGRIHPNRHGTYFRRLIRYELGDSDPINPLAIMIQKMRDQLSRARSLRCAYELPVYRPDLDAKVLMGFPCLSHLSFSLYGNCVRLTALYRNQYYVERLFGNLLGLARLLSFVASQIGKEGGELTCHASHAAFGQSINRRDVRRLLERCRSILFGSAAANT